MVYEKHTWETGQIISADKLNNIEEGIANFGDNLGYECSVEPQDIINESITTSSTPLSQSYCQGNFSYGELINADSIIVTFDGQQYELSKTVSDNINYYGGSSDDDFSQNPFVIESTNYNGQIFNLLFTPNEGTYAVKVTADVTSVSSVTPGFDLAVKSVYAGIKPVEIFPVYFIRNGDTFYIQTPYKDVKQAYRDGKILVAQEGVECEGFLAGIEDEYGNTNFKFIFLKPFDDDSGLECAIVKLKYNDTVTATIKKITLENLT